MNSLIKYGLETKKRSLKLREHFILYLHIKFMQCIEIDSFIRKKRNILSAQPIVIRQNNTDACIFSDNRKPPLRDPFRTRFPHTNKQTHKLTRTRIKTLKRRTLVTSHDESDETKRIVLNRRT